MNRPGAFRCRPLPGTDGLDFRGLPPLAVGTSNPGFPGGVEALALLGFLPPWGLPLPGSREPRRRDPLLPYFRKDARSGSLSLYSKVSKNQVIGLASPEAACPFEVSALFP